MNLRRRQQMVMGAAVIVGLASAGMLLAGWMLPVRIAGPESEKLRAARKAIALPDQGETKPAGKSAALFNLAELEKLCSRNLRQPLTQGPETNAGTSGSTLTLQLVGTINEAGHSMAMLKKNDGSIAVCALGQSVDDVGGPVVVTKIELDHILVQFDGASRELRLPPKAPVLEQFEP